MIERELIEKLKLKDEKAFKVFIDLYKSMIINICYKFLRNKYDAEDLSQEVFIEIFYSIKHFKNQSKLSTWIYRIAVNKCLDFQKKQKRRKRFGSVLSIFGLDNLEKALQDNHNPHKILVQSERQNQLLKAINKLTDNQKAALTLAKIDGLSYSEIALILNTTTTAIESLIQRAKNNLKKYLEADGF